MKKINILFASCLLATTAMAQNTKVTSHIKSTNGRPVSGAIISIVGEKSTALSDEKGMFTLDTDIKNALITIKADGFYAREIPLSYLKKITGTSTSTITLIPEDEALYSGTSSTIFGKISNDKHSTSTSSVESKDFTEKQNLGAAMRDNIAGLQVIEKSGMPGEGSYMNIRGIHSFVAENNPLVVINGIPFFGNKMCPE